MDFHGTNTVRQRPFDGYLFVLLRGLPARHLIGITLDNAHLFFFVVLVVTKTAFDDFERPR